MPLSRRPIFRVAPMIAGCAITAAVILSPLIVASTSKVLNLDWHNLSEIGQAYGFASALVSALTLLAASLSVAAQVKSHQSTRRQAIHSMRASVLQIALNDPETYMPCYGAATPEEIRKSQQNLFCELRANSWLAARESGEEVTTGITSGTERHCDHRRLPPDRGQP